RPLVRGFRSTAYVGLLAAVKNEARTSHLGHPDPSSTTVPGPTKDYGFVMAVAFSVTAVCASARPVILAPVLNAISVLERMMPLKSEVVPSVALPATCQNTFLACAPPLKVTMAPLPTVRFCAMWKVQTSFVRL